jgi:mycofactocin precursor
MTVTTTASFAAAQPVGATPVAATEPDPVAGDQEQLIEADLLVEDVSIDGMCGVY